MGSGRGWGLEVQLEQERAGGSALRPSQLEQLQSFSQGRSHPESAGLRPGSQGPTAHLYPVWKLPELQTKVLPCWVELILLVVPLVVSARAGAPEGCGPPAKA